MYLNQQVSEVSKSVLKAALLMGAALPLQANELYGSWYWHAFASQAVIHTTDNNYFGSSDDSLSTEFRELGLILGGEPLPNLSLVGQILSLKAGEVDDGDLRVDYAFANYNFWANPTSTFGVKLGKLRTPYGFYNETRDAAHTRSSILLPQSIYYDRLREPVFARTGAQLFGTYRHGESTFSWDLGYTKPEIQAQYADEFLGSGFKVLGRIEPDYSPVSRVLWDWDMGRVRLGFTYQVPQLRYEAASMDFLSSTDVKISGWVASAEYNAADWSLISEYSRLSFDLGGLVQGMQIDIGNENYYIQGIYRFSPGWDMFLRWDVQNAENTITQSGPISSTRDATFGIGWRPTKNWLLRGEWHLIDGTSWLSSQENPEAERVKHWQMVLFQVSYHL